MRRLRKEAKSQKQKRKSRRRSEESEDEVLIRCPACRFGERKDLAAAAIQAKPQLLLLLQQLETDHWLLLWLANPRRWPPPTAIASRTN